ncbi:MAG: hypothetical protein Q8M16_06350 [Pirellulaceae bacterium]|nr:hypothetical protein [Pirellulaceae bacterium]
MDWLKKPENLLLTDAVGAVATALATGLFLATSLLPTGIPSWILWVLSLAAAGYAVFDILSYRLAHGSSWPLATIGGLNLLYCATAIGLCLGHWSSLTVFGAIYFGLESAIVIPLAIMELWVSTRNLKSQIWNMKSKR